MPAEKPERVAEARFVREARAKNFITRKMNGLGNASWPDQLVIGQGFDLYIEFKKVGKEPTALQADMHRDLRKRGKWIYVAYTAAGAWDAVRDAAYRQGVLPRGLK